MTRVVVCLRSALVSEAVAEALRTNHDLDAVATSPPAVAEAARDLDSTVAVLIDAVAARQLAPRELLGATVVVVGQREDDAGGLEGVAARVPADVELDQLVDALRAAPTGEISSAKRSRTTVGRARRSTDGHHLLTDREQQVLELLDAAATPREIAARIGISEHTVRTHLQNLLGKLDARSKVDAVARGRELGLLGGPRLR